MAGNGSARDTMKSSFGHAGPARIMFERDAKAQSDQQKGFGPPPLQKPISEDADVIALPEVEPNELRTRDLHHCIAARRSRRKYADEPLTLDQLGMLLWATQGVQEVVGNGYATFRTVPSGGARHALETYVIALRTVDLPQGVFRYMPLDHSLVYLFGEDDLGARIGEVCCGQHFVGTAGAVFVWSGVPYRCEWRYPHEASKLMLLDVGHVCQNLYIACEALGLGTCAIAAYEQAPLDALLRLDGRDEFAMYLAPVGTRPGQPEA